VLWSITKQGDAIKHLVAVLFSASLTWVFAPQGTPNINNQAQEVVKTSSSAKVEKPVGKTKVPVGVKKAKVQRPSGTTSKKKLPTPAPIPEPTPVNHQEILAAAGVPSHEWPAAEFIIQHESSWRPTVRNSEGCVGLGQRCPASVLLNDCPDLNAVCQVKHFTRYANARYGGWQQAYNVWVTQRWW